jgi:hypothetical protein
MNSSGTRRAVLRSALGLALFPLVPPRAARASAEAAGPIAPPAGEMIYRRTLQRQLPGGAMLATTRDFRVRFSAGPAGYQVEGTQVRARVEAPASLASLARLEEQRVEGGIFPLTLDHHGHILDGAGMTMTEQVSLALEDVRQRFATTGREVHELLGALTAGSSRFAAYLPHDLFAPAHDDVERRETIILPWGQAGEVRMRFSASRDPDSRLMRLATRDVITTLDGDERRSTERWELFEA